MQDNLQWDMQVNTIINKIRFTYHRVQPLLRDDNIPCYIKMRLVNAIICPLAMYGAEAWSPSADQMRAIVASMGKIYRRVASCPKRVVSEIIDNILMVNMPEREYVYLRRLFHRFSRFCNLEGVHNHMVDLACYKAELIDNPNRCTTSYQRFYEIINDGNTFETKHQLKMWADEFNVNHKMRLFNAKHERREHKLAPVVVEWMNATQLDGMRRPTIWNLTRTFKSSEIGWILRCIGSTELVFGPDHICTECRAPCTLQHCTSECELLPPDERVDMQSLLWDCDPTVKGDSGSSAKLEYKKLLRIAKRQLVECDTTQLVRGDKLTVLWKSGLRWL